MTNLVLTNSFEPPKFPQKSPKVGTRGHAIERVGVELGRVHADNDYQFSILMVEVQGLSALTYLGDSAQSSLLKSVTGILTEGLGPQDMCCRLGGDEFLLICPSQTGPQCRDLVERLSQRCADTFSTGNADVLVSVGCASSARGSTIETLFATADESMHPLPVKALPLPQGLPVTKRPAVGFFAGLVGVFAEA